MEYLRGTSTWEQMHVMCAERYQSDGLLGRAAREYEALIAATPFNVSPYLRLGVLYLTSGVRAEARNVLVRSLQIERTSRAHIMLGQIEYEERRYDDAVDHLRQALSIGQVDTGSAPDVRLSLAVALQRAGRAQESLEEVRRLRDLYPSFQPAVEFESYLTQ